LAPVRHTERRYDVDLTSYDVLGRCGDVVRRFSASERRLDDVERRHKASGVSGVLGASYGVDTTPSTHI
jgi:hypothetical protein